MKPFGNNVAFVLDDCAIEVIADSLSPKGGDRITTFRLRYPRIIHSEFMTHRAFSRNAQSSRATPVKTMLRDMAVTHWRPRRWLANGKGMVAKGEVTADAARKADEIWDEAFANACAAARELAALGISKQYTNRLLEPFSHITVLVTATEWDNFFKLRIDDRAQPEIRTLAYGMRLALETSKPVERQWHLPFIDDEDKLAPDTTPDEKYFIESVAKCARVSYLKFDGEPPTQEDNELLVAKLLFDPDRRHLTPFEHQAVATLNAFGLTANLAGWMSTRTMMEKEME